MRRGLLLGLALLLVAAASLSVLPAERGAAQTPDTPQPNALGTYTVPADWPLVPAGIRPGHSFRLLFVTRDLYFPGSADIADYNTLLQNLASSGHRSIQPYASLFKIVGSTSAVDARDNSETNPDPNEDGPGVRIYWLDGAKVADDYADFYDGAWESKRARDELGKTREAPVWTGSNQDGTAYLNRELDSGTEIRIGWAGETSPTRNPISHEDFLPGNLGDVGFSYYGLSPVFTVGRHSTPASAGITFVPYDWELIPGGLDAGDTFRLLFMTSEKRDATDANLFTYDAFVQAAAAAGHEAIQPYAALFRVVASNRAIGARDHIGAIPGADPNAQIYWLNGPRVAASNSDFWGTWEHWTQADRRFESGLVADDDQPWTGTQSDGTTHGNFHLGTKHTDATAIIGGAPGSTDPIYVGTPVPITESHSFYALSAIFEVREPPPRAVFSTTHMTVAEPPGCAGDTTEQFGAIHDRELATYTVRLSSDPGGEATVVVLDPSDSRSGFNRYAGNWGRVTNQPDGETSAVTDRSNSGTLLRFDSSDWEDPQTVRLNIHCADHDPHVWNEIWHRVQYPGDRVNIREPRPGVPGQMQTRTVVNPRWQVTRLRVVDTAAPAQPADLSVASAYAGTLTASLSGSVYTRCQSTEPGGDCEWGFGVQWDWTTSAHPNDIFDAERRFWGFRFKVESGAGSDEWTYSYVPQPTYTRMVKPRAVTGWSMQRNTASYHGSVEPSGLYTAFGSAGNPGNPVYRITVTPVTLLGEEVPGEADTMCVQLQSRLPQVVKNKHAVVVDCDTLFTPPEAIPGLIPMGLFAPRSSLLLVLPALTITSDAVAVDEGERVTFTITAASPAVVDTTVELSLTEELGDEGDRIGRHQLGTVTIRAGERSATWTVTTLADEVERGGGFALAELRHGDGYTLGEPSSVSVALTDDDAPATPELSISGGSGITEGGTASFTITASPAPASPITVNVGVSERGAFGASGAATVEVSGAATTYTVSTADDELDEADGSVTVTLLDGGGYTVSASRGAATVAVADDDAGHTVDPQVVASVQSWMAETHHGAAHVNRWQRVLVAFGALDADGVSGGAMSAAEAQGYADRGWQRWVPVVAELAALEASRSGQPTPELSISAGGGITEGGMASFTITASPAPAADLDVTVTVSQSGDYGATTGARTVTIPATGSATLTVGTTDDGNDEADGSLTATVNSGSGYTVSSTNGAATVSVADDDVPELRISAGGAITEGGDATFTITARPAPASDLDITVTVSASGDYGATTGTRTVTIPATGSATLTVGTTDDGADEADGSVTATVNGGSGYTVSSTNGAATVAVADDDVPELRISAGGGITEGGDARFTVTASPAPAADLDVSVTVSASGDYGATTGARTLTIPATGSVTLTVGTTDDGADEAHGSVTATVNGGSGYTVSSTNGAATVVISDDDVPELRISAGGGITEGGTASFTITASPAPASPLTVRVAVSQRGAFGASGAATITVSGVSTTYTVSTTDDQLDEADGSVTATLQDGGGYTVSTAQGAAMVMVADDDEAPTPDAALGVSIEEASATEGGYLEFTVRLSRAATAEILVRWNTATAWGVPDGRAHSDDYTGVYDEFVFEPGVTELTGEVWLEPDGEAEGDEHFAVELFLGEDWKFRPDATGIMTIIDGD